MICARRAAAKYFGVNLSPGDCALGWRARDRERRRLFRPPPHTLGTTLSKNAAVHTDTVHTFA